MTEREEEIVVVGGGVSGLACAHFLRMRGYDPVVLEAARRPGGKLWSESVEGAILEHGPASLRGGGAAFEELVASLGLTDRLVDPSPAAARRFILRDGTPQPVPSGPASFFGSRLLSPRAKLRVLAEPFIPRRGARYGESEEQSVTGFITRRLGREVNDYAVEPFVAGIFAGDPDRLDVASAFPMLPELERRYGSVLRGAIATAGRAARTRAGGGSSGADRSAAARSGQLTFTRGLSELTDAIAATLGDRLVLEACVTAIRRAGRGYELTLQHGGRERTLRGRCVIIAVPAYSAAEIVRPVVPSGADALSAIPYPPVIVVSAVYPRAALRRQFDGFGLLIPRRERRRVLGIIYASSVFQHRSAENSMLFTIFAGGARDAALLRETPRDRLLQLTLSETEALLGLRGAPSLVRDTLWERAIPQYAPGHRGRMALLSELEAQYPGLRFLGNYRGGVAIAACLREARRTAESVAGGLAVAEP